MSSTASPVVWVATVVGLLAIVVFDLVVIARRHRTVSIGLASRWIVGYVALAAAFAVALLVFAGERVAEEFAAGYVTEYTLSVDNLFVFLIIMNRFQVPALAVDKVLYIGIVLSMLLRTVFIAAGAAALQAASWVFFVFGAMLVYTAVRLVTGGDDESFEEGRVLRGLRRVLPLSADYDGPALTTHEPGHRVMTPLVIVIAAIGLANVMFALDSIPAIFGLTQDPYIVFTANALALMGLRQLYFLVEGLLERIIYLNAGLAVILGFIGVKMVLEGLHGVHVDDVGGVPMPEIGILTSIGFIVGTLLVTTLASLMRVRARERG